MITIPPPYYAVIGCFFGWRRSEPCQQIIEEMYYQAYNSTNPGLSITRVRFGQGPLCAISEVLRISDFFSYRHLKPTSFVVVMEQEMKNRVLQEATHHPELQENLPERTICLNMPGIRTLRDITTPSSQMKRDMRQKLEHHLRFSTTGLEITP